MDNNSLTHRHDRTFRNAMSDLRVARENAGSLANGEIFSQNY